jgi:hypothetical protein
MLRVDDLEERGAGGDRVAKIRRRNVLLLLGERLAERVVLRLR